MRTVKTEWKNTVHKSVDQLIVTLDNGNSASFVNIAWEESDATGANELLEFLESNGYLKVERN